jgi:hypothetical protein
MSTQGLTPRIGAVAPVELQQAALTAAESVWPGCGMSGAVRLALARLAGLPDQAARLPMGRPRQSKPIPSAD